MRILLLDGDIIARKVAHGLEKQIYRYTDHKGKPGRIDAQSYRYLASHVEPEHLARFQFMEDWEVSEETAAFTGVDHSIDRAMQQSGAGSFKIFLSPHECFRNQIYPEYKANRIGMRRPALLDATKQYILNWHKGQMGANIEADDLLGIHQGDNTIIGSIDKDLLMVPGMHLNLNRGVITEVNEFDGLLHFYQQVLTGDSVDNIKGIRGVGPATAKDILHGSKSESEMEEKTIEAYLRSIIGEGASSPEEDESESRFAEEAYRLARGEATEQVTLNQELLWILQREGETFSKRKARLGL